MSKFPMPSAAEFQAMTPDQFELFWKTFDAMGTAKTAPFLGRWFIYANEIRDCCTLKRAGWRPEPQTGMAQLMAWFWRRPVRPGSRDRKGKLFHSTSSALAEQRRSEMLASKSIATYAFEYHADGKTLHGSFEAISPLHAQQIADSFRGKLV